MPSPTAASGPLRAVARVAALCGAGALPNSDGGMVLRAFPTSLLIAGGPGGAALFVDTDGKPVDAPGWPSTSTPMLRGRNLPTPRNPWDFLVAGGVIYGPEDRALKRVADVPPGVDPATIADVRGNFVVTSVSALKERVIERSQPISSSTRSTAASSAIDAVCVAAARGMSALHSALSKTQATGVPHARAVYSARHLPC